MDFFHWEINGKIEESISRTHQDRLCEVFHRRAILVLNDSVMFRIVSAHSLLLQLLLLLLLQLLKLLLAVQIY